MKGTEDEHSLQLHGLYQCFYDDATLQFSRVASYLLEMASALQVLWVCRTESPVGTADRP